jgi:cytochrome bd ubiquinol oxidase subunit II
VLRGSAFIFRAYGPMSQRDKRGLEWVFATASTITPLLLGVVVGAVTEGRIVHDIHGAASFRELYVNPWLTPFAVAVGVFALVLFSYLAAVYLTLEAREKATADAFRRRAFAAAILTGVMALVIFLLAGDAPHVRASLTSSPWALPLHLATGAAAIAAIVLLWRRHFWWARTAAIIQVSLIVWGWALAQSPYLIRPDLTFEMAAAPRQVLVLLLQILAAGAIVLLPSLFYLFRLFGPEEKSV